MEINIATGFPGGSKLHKGIWVVATQWFFIFTYQTGERIQFDEHIFQRGWFNHQLGNICWSLKKSFENTLQKEDLIGLYRFYMFTTLGGLYMYMYIV